MRKSGILYVELVLLAVAAIWGVNPAIMKIGLVDLQPMPYNCLRMIVAVLVVWPLFALSKTYRPMGKKDFKQMVIISVFGFFVFQLFFTVGVEQTTAGNASVFLSLLPVVVAVIHRLFRIETIGSRMAAGIALSVAGVALIVIGSGREVSLAGNHLLGALMLLTASSGFGIFTVFSRELIQKYSIYQVTAYMLTISGLLFLLISVPQMLSLQWSQIPARAWLSVLFSGIVAICLANFMWAWGVDKIGSGNTAVYNNLSPVFAIISGYLMLGETFGFIQLAGTVIIFAGLYLTRHRGSLSPAEPERR